MCKKKIKCEICLKMVDERVIYEYIVETFLMLESVCLSCLFRVKVIRGDITRTPIMKII
jgi:hypothetical protein